MAPTFGTRVFRGFAVTSSGGAVETLLQFGSLVLLARLLSPEVFGVVYPMSAVFMMITAFLTTGIEQTLVQKKHIDTETEQIATHLLFAGSVLVFIIISVFISFSFRTIDNRDEQIVAHILSLTLPLQATKAYAHGQLTQRLAFRTLAALSVLQSLIFVMLAIGLAVWVPSPFALAIPLVAQWAVYLPLCRRVPRLLVNRPPPLRAFVDFLRVGGPMSGASVARNVATHVDQAAAGFYVPQTAGLYNRASMLAQTPGRVSNSMAKQLGLAALSQLRDEPVRFGRAYRQGTAMLASVGIPGTVFMLYDARLLLEVVLGSQWVAGTTVFLILTTLTHYHLVRRMPAWVVVATRPWWYLHWSLPFLLIKIAVCFTFGTQSVEWLAASVVFVHVIDFAVLVVMASRVCPVNMKHFLLAHRGGAILGAATLVLLASADLLLGGAGLPAWQTLFIHALLGGTLFFAVVVTGGLGRIDEDHRWINAQMQNLLNELLSASAKVVSKLRTRRRGVGERQR